MREYELADFLAANFWDDSSGKRKVGKLCCHVITVVMPFEGREDTIAEGDFPHDAIQAIKP